MIQKARQAQAGSKAATPLPIVLFGLDQHGKPTAARFAGTQAALAAKAAQQLRLRVLTVANPAVAELAAKLPTGRIHASGKRFVPNVRTDLYTKLMTAAGAPSNGAQSPAQASGEAQSNGGGVKTKKPAQDRLPKDWDAIAPGHLVVAQQSLEDGWYEAIVLEQNGDMFTLRWRDHAQLSTIVRPRLSLALLPKREVIPRTVA